MTNSTRDSRVSRRSVLAGAGSLGAVGLAGCLGGAADEPSDDGPTAVASFFTFYDFARQVAEGTPLSVRNLVPTGLHGHGWEPDPSITRDIIDAEAFLHVGPDFQPWADRAIQTVKDDEAETDLVNVREGIDLLPLGAGLDEDEEVADGRDPHFWLDPQRAKQSVDNIVAGLADVVPDHAETLAENGEALRADLDTIDDEWEAIFEAAEREVAFLAAHNAFQYVSDRYGATVEPLVTNLAASDDVRPADMQRARKTIEEYDIQYIGAAVFEPRRPARQLVEDTRVEAYYPVTPYAGTTEAWVDRGWGYAEIARNINMETFRIALGATSPDETGLGAEWRNFE
ncbi:metal ABC transporter substrate-binding protein [Natronomonas halophila]|uniref:metal ABC transporter substrate-binding protein n=1 Tax=Natronomonas halophila TaxID=2747817 RepID=UPI0015B70540|nr:metal ABC transporter substrate-binding protein [Natronomonas halophila]QLD84767.1 metal ABC transporter substrate-binding protein [Natronomonas halophila]